MGRAMSQLATCADNMPSTIVIWFRETSRPRMPAGAISEMYIGESADANPMEAPPSILQKTNISKVLARPVANDDTEKPAAEMINENLRPSRSLRIPENRAPNRQPSSAQLIAQPC